jgi:hypothetical protein
VSRARLLAPLAAFSPLLAAGLLVAAHAVEVPVWDDLERATLIDAWQKGTLDWTYLYSPHIESRMVVPRFITLINAKWFGGTLVLEHAVIFALVALTALAVHALLRQSFAERPVALWGLTFLANLLLLSPMHWETFLWAAQMGYVVPPLALVLSLWVLGTRWHPAARLVACALLCLGATWSHCYGVALWGLLFAYGLLERGFASPRARAFFLGAWALVSLTVLVPHSTVHGFRHGSDRGGVRVDESAPGPEFATLSDRTARAALFGAAMLGSPLARTAATAAEPLGQTRARYPARLTRPSWPRRREAGSRRGACGRRLRTSRAREAFPSAAAGLPCSRSRRSGRRPGGLRGTLPSPLDER